MAGEGETRKFGRPESLSTAAIVIAIISGGGGVGLNSYSNASVLKKLDEVSTSITRIEEDRKSIAEDRKRTDSTISNLAKTIADDHDEIANLKTKIAVIETKVH